MKKLIFTAVDSSSLFILNLFITELFQPQFLCHLQWKTEEYLTIIDNETKYKIV